MTEGLQLSIPRRMTLLRVTLVFSLIFSMIMSFNLWGGQRHFPLTPLIDTETVRPPFDFIFMGVALLSWIASTILRKQRVFLFLSFVISAWLVFADVNRLQPWFYFYNAMLAVYIFYNGRVDDPNKYTSFFIILQIIVASLYFFSGLNQLNEQFIEREFIGIISPMKGFVSARQFNLFVKLGYSVPYIMMFIGVGLMISPIRYLAITMAVLIHLLLIIFFFPSATNTDYALWLSNITFLLTIILLFSGKTKQRYFSPTFLLQMPLFYIVLVLFVIMPFFNRKQLWPDFLSSNFRSGNNREAVITISKNVYERLPLYERHFYLATGERYKLDYMTWCREELNAECFPDEKVFNSICSYLASLDNGDVKEIELNYRPSDSLLRKP